MRALAAVLLLVPLAACVAPADPAAPGPQAGERTPLAWTALPDAAGSRVEVASAVLGTRIFVVGGFTEDGAAVATTEAFDAATGKWEAAPSYPYLLHHAAAVGVPSDAGPEGVYVFGGWTSHPLPDPVPPLPAPSALVFRLAPDGASWTPLAPMPAPRGAHTAALVAGKVYVVGGVSERLELAAETWVYDPKADAWTTGPAMPTPRDHVTSVELDGRLVVVEGQRLSHADVLGAMESFDPAAGEWTRLADAPTPRNAMVAGVVAGRIVVAGGQTDVDVFDIVEAYDPKTDSWSTLAPMPTARHGLAAGVVEGRLFTLLGGTVAGSPVDLSRAVESIGP